jgi:hypothetical protein
VSPLPLFAALVVLLFLALEALRHSRRLHRIPIRIHVNGTRGKTSVVRLLAAALRAAGIRTVAKVTGDAPLLILPDGTEQPIRRRGPARIQEQLWFIRQAATWQAEAIVVECMALAPELQRVSEERMIRSTIGVITNVRPDHFEVMGEDLEAIARALAGTIPRQGVLVTADRSFLAYFERCAAAQGSRTLLAAPAGDPGRPIEPAAEHAALVAGVLAELGHPPPAPASTAIRPLVWQLARAGRRTVFVNAFSANDPVSTALLQRSAAARSTLVGPRVALLNNRADRPRRMLAFAEALRADDTYADVALGGDLAALADRKLRRSGRRTWQLATNDPEQMVEEIGRRLGCPEFTLVGMGNAKGLGLACARYFEEKGTPCP